MQRLKITCHYKNIMVLELPLPPADISHINTNCPAQLTHPERRLSLDKISLLVYEWNFRHQEYNNLSLGPSRLKGCDPSDQKCANEGFAAACVQSGYNVRCLSTIKDFLLVPTREEGF